jgi:polyisoprenoid-binding protein YceI
MKMSLVLHRCKRFLAAVHLPIASCLSLVLVCCQGPVDAAPGGSAPAAQDAVTQTSFATRIGAPTEPADWTLVPAESYLSFISVKQTDIAEVSCFERFDVSVGADGNALVRIDLTSVATGVDLRDQRVRDHLFEVTSFPEASVNLALDMVAASAIAVGSKVSMPTSATVTLRAISVAVSADVEIMRLAADKVVVTPKKPIVLHASDFNMSAGIAYLVSLAGLESISSAVPVDFMFTLAVNPAAAPL